MSPASSKISKISLGQVKRQFEAYKNSLVEEAEDKIYSEIADIMMGKDFPDKAVRNQKIADMKQGKYNDLTITFNPSEHEICGRYFQNLTYPITTTVEELGSTLFYAERTQKFEKGPNLEKQALSRVEESGIVFLDEIDKLAYGGQFSTVKSVSREGVQRDLLPLIEGTTVTTKIGDVSTNNILFIASGAFSMCKPEDLIPELLGRLPIRVSMSPIEESEFVRILSEPKYNLLLQQVKLLEQEGIQLEYTPESIKQMAKFAYMLNTNHENMGARRLHAITEKIIEDLSFECSGQQGMVYRIDAQYVIDRLKDEGAKIELSKYLI